MSILFAFSSFAGSNVGGVSYRGSLFSLTFVRSGFGRNHMIWLLIAQKMDEISYGTRSAGRDYGRPRWMGKERTSKKFANFLHSLFPLPNAIAPQCTCHPTLPSPLTGLYLSWMTKRSFARSQTGMVDSLEWPHLEDSTSWSTYLNPDPTNERTVQFYESQSSQQPPTSQPNPKVYFVAKGKAAVWLRDCLSSLLSSLAADPERGGTRLWDACFN